LSRGVSGRNMNVEDRVQEGLIENHRPRKIVLKKNASTTLACKRDLRGNGEEKRVGPWGPISRGGWRKTKPGWISSKKTKKIVGRCCGGSEKINMPFSPEKGRERGGCRTSKSGRKQMQRRMRAKEEQSGINEKIAPGPKPSD